MKTKIAQGIVIDLDPANRSYARPPGARSHP
jgi:hypothetical protein